MSAAIPVYPDLAGEVAVVTGSSRGIGAATCRMLAANGAKGEATAVAADVTELDALERLREETERTYGPAEVLGAFVAGGGPVHGPPRQVPPAGWAAATP